MKKLFLALIILLGCHRPLPNKDSIYRVQLPSILVYQVCLKNKEDNHGAIWIGSRGVTKENGYELDVGTTWCVTLEGNLNIVYYIPEVMGDTLFIQAYVPL